MSAHSWVVLYGNSVFLAGIKAELELDPGIELISVDTESTDMMERIRDHKPRALLFDLAEGQPNFAVTLLHEQPSLLLIGVDPSSDEQLVLSNRPAQALTLSDLIELTRIRTDTGKESYRER